MKGRVLSDTALLMHEDDNVATAIDDLEAGDQLDYDGATITLHEDVPFGHKVALVDLKGGVPIRKYGQIIGSSTQSIEAGEWVHTHNCESNRGRGDKTAEEAGAAVVGDAE